MSWLLAIGGLILAHDSDSKLGVVCGAVVAIAGGVLWALEKGFLT